MNPAIVTGSLKEKLNNGNILKQNYNVKILCYEHLSQIMKLQQIIVENVSTPELFEPMSCEFMEEHIERNGFVLGAFVREELIAFRVVYYPHDQDKYWNLGFDIGLSPEQRAKVANLQMVCVHPGYRGNALASKLNHLSLRILREQGEYEHVCATVSPYNIWNIRILLNCGFRVRQLKIKYGWKLRYIVYQDLRSPLKFSDSGGVCLPLSDLEAQKEALQSGRYGVAVAHNRNLSRVSQKDLLGSSLIVFKPPVVEPAVHVVKRKALSKREENYSGTGRNLHDTVLLDSWDVAGEPLHVASYSTEMERTFYSR